MDQFAKYASKLSPDERGRYKELLVRIKSGNIAGLDIKKLKGHHARYRVRLGATRIIYEVVGGIYNLVQVGSRNDNTYRK